MIEKITTDDDYEKALDRLKEIFDCDIGTPEGIECQRLCELLHEYEEKRFPFTYDLADTYFYEDYEDK